MGKLVRDLIPDLIRADGHEPRVRQLAPDEVMAALHAKLLEEAGELRTAQPEQRLEEAADVYEVLRAIAHLSGFDLEAVAEAAEVKRSLRGGFERRLWLET